MRFSEVCKRIDNLELFSFIVHVLLKPDILLKFCTLFSLNGYYFEQSHSQASVNLLSIVVNLLVVNLLSICCQSVVNLLSIGCQSVVNRLSICCQSVVNLLSICCQSVVNLLSICCQSVVNLLSICCQSVVNLLSIC